MIAKTFFGFEDILEKELVALGATRVKKGVRNVSFWGDKGFMYKANLCLRTALKILKPIYFFKAQDQGEYYRRLREFPWDEVMSLGQTFCVNVTSSSTVFVHSQFMSYKAKDAIVDFFRGKYSKRPNVSTANPDYEIEIHISQRNEVTVLLNTSGESLHHRGYRTATNIAPINEVLAAGILLLSGWRGQCDFLDPMCGSGTFPIEAAMIALNIPPNLHRTFYAFQGWADYDVDLFETIFDSSLSKSRDFSYSIFGYDKAPSAFSKSTSNVSNVNLSDFISIEQADFFNTKKRTSSPLHLVFNPPYGNRLGVDLHSFYKKIGDTLKVGYPDTEAWIITSSSEAIKNIGLRPSSRIKLFNGSLESKLLKFSIYEGTKKVHKFGTLQ